MPQILSIAALSPYPSKPLENRWVTIMSHFTVILGPYQGHFMPSRTHLQKFWNTIWWPAHQKSIHKASKTLWWEIWGHILKVLLKNRQVGEHWGQTNGTLSNDLHSIQPNKNSKTNFIEPDSFWGSRGSCSNTKRSKRYTKTNVNRDLTSRISPLFCLVIRHTTLALHGRKPSFFIPKTILYKSQPEGYIKSLIVYNIRYLALF